MRTARQGTFDGLCGVYAVVNAASVALESGRRSQLHKDLFTQLTHSLGATALLAAMHVGLDGRELMRASATAFAWLLSEYGVELGIYRPYRNREFATAASFTAELQGRMALPSTAVILQVRLPKSNHWTVAKAFTGRRLLLRDSSGLTALPLTDFTLSRGPNRFLPHETLVVQRLG